MAFNSEEINLLVYRYLEEAGYEHSAYVFGNESSISQSNVNGAVVPPGALILLLERALHYTYADISIADDGSERVIFAFNLLDAVIPENINRVRVSAASSMTMMGESNDKLAALRTDSFGNSLSKPEILPDKSTVNTPIMNGSNSNVQTNYTNNSTNSIVFSHNNIPTVPDMNSVSGPMIPVSRNRNSQSPLIHHHPNSGLQPFHSSPNVSVNCIPPSNSLGHNLSQSANPTSTPGHRKHYNNVLQSHQQPSVMVKNGKQEHTPDYNKEDRAVRLPNERVTKLNGHNSEVFICAWNPKRDILASGSGDSTARIWNLEGPELKNITLTHFINRDGRDIVSNKDVTSLDWNSDGTCLATGSYDGFARVWDVQGTLVTTLGQHKGPIFALKWSHKSNYILTAGVDKSAIIWEVGNGRVTQQFQFHGAPTLDVDWQSNVCFASCSTDTNIHVCRLGFREPVKTFRGHSNEVNAIKWDPEGNLLASCSDDMTLKVWSCDSDKCIIDFKGHKKEIYTMKWSPQVDTGGSPRKLIASASFDSTVRLWDVNQAKCIRTLNKHTEPVYSVSFSPNGQLLATGSFDQWVLIWKVDTGELVNSWKCTGGIFEVCWNRKGTKVAASASDGSVVVLDMSG